MQTNIYCGMFHFTGFVSVSSVVVYVTMDG